MFKRCLNDPVYAATTSGMLITGFLAAFLLVQIVGGILDWDREDIPPKGTITVSGEGEVLAVPDLASFTFTVMENADSVENAQNIATAKINEATEFLKNNGVDEKDIKTQSYNVYPKYDYSRVCTALDCPPSTPKIVGYEVSQITRVKVRQQEEAARFITELGRIGISNISSLQFTIDDEDALYEQARTEAIKDAKEKAKKLARELKVKLEGVISFGEDNPNTYDHAYAGLGGAKTMESAAVPEISVGENSYTSNVWITYKID